MKFHNVKSLAILVFIIFVHFLARSQNHLTINLASSDVLTGSLENLQESVLINVINTSGVSQNVFFVLNMQGLSGEGSGLHIDNQLSANGAEIEIPPGGRVFTLDQLINEFQNQTIDDFTISPSALAGRIQLTRQLPQGDYRICLEARDVITQQLLSLPGENNCLNFSVQYRNPPVIQSPVNNSWLQDNETDELTFSWNLDLNPGIDDDFTLELIHLPTEEIAADFFEQGNPSELFDMYDRVIRAEHIGTYSYNTLAADDLQDMENGFYAVRVSINSSLNYLNNGQSQIVVFYYGPVNQCLNPSFNASFVYPSPGDTLPFYNIFPIVRFQPSCDNLRRMEGQLNTFIQHGSSGGLLTSTINYNPNWTSGPGPSLFLHNYFSVHFPSSLDFYYPFGSEYEQYQPFLYDQNSAFTRGDRFGYSGLVRLYYKSLQDHNIYNQTINLNEFFSSNPCVFGMPKPILDEPENDAVFSSGNVDFSFSTGNVSGNPLPLFKIFKIEGDNPPIVPNLVTREKCVLQVATNISFDNNSIVFCTLKKIQGNPYDNRDVFNEDNPNWEPFSGTFDATPARLFDQDNWINDVYKDINISHQFSQNDTYYWRVVWLKNPDQFTTLSPCQTGSVISDADIYHQSAIRRFSIEAGEIADPAASREMIYCAQMYDMEEDDDEAEGENSESECSSPCDFPRITDNTASGGVYGSNTFTVAGFAVEVTEAGIGTSSNGTGAIVIPFLNNIKVRINFSGVQLNAARQMIGGTITPVRDQSFPLSSHTSSVGRILGMDETSADAMEASIEAGGKLLSLLASGSQVSLPIGIDKEVGENRIIIGVTNMTFKKDTAHMDIVVNIRIPTMQELNGFISLGAQVCITNEGLGNDVRLYLPQDQVFPLGSTNEFRIKGAFENPSISNITSVEWDCNGFKALNLAGSIRFTREWLLPEDERGNIKETGQVEARFAGRYTNGGNILIRLDMDNFQIPGAEGWGFTPARNVWIDLSDIQNPEGMRSALPDGYLHPAFSGSGMENTWKGFYMEELSVKTPEHLQGPDHNRLTFALRNMFIDNTGLTFRASAENILRWDGNGDMNGWAASLDTVFLDIVQNNFEAFGFSGKLGLPIADATQYMKYRAALEHHDGNFNLVVSVKPAENLRIPVSMAMATIRTGSYITLSIGSESFIEANLCASLSISNSNLSERPMSGSLNMPQIVIQNLRVNSETGFDTTAFAYSLTGLGDFGGPGGGRSGGGDVWFDNDESLFLLPAESSESTLSGFPIGLDHFSFSNDKITIQPRLTLTGSEGGFSAAAKVSLLINMDLTSSPQRFDVTGVQLERIDLNIESSDVTLAGYLEFYKTPTLEGVRGGLTVGLNLGMRIGIDINADFGTYKEAAASTFNTPQWYSFFYVDGTVIFTPGITLFSGVSLYGLGGGFYHHMRRTGALPSGGSVMTPSSAPPRPRESMPYEPHFATDLGLKFIVILGSNDNGQAYNLDVELEATFSFAHGLTMIQLTGSFRVMSDGISIATLGREGNSPVAGYVRLTLNTPPAAPATFNGQFFVKLKVPTSSPILYGLGSVPNPPSGWTADHAMVWATFKASPEENYFWMGTPTNRCGVALGIGGQNLAEVTTYLMIGDGVPTVMPEPHADFVRIFNRGLNASTTGDPGAFLAGNPRPVPTGSGFAFGMTMRMGFDAEFFPFFFALNAVMGFDINITKALEGDRTCAGTGMIPGSDGWYAMGQMYAGIEGRFGIRINLFFDVIEANILSAGAALILQGGLPNPEWISGRGSMYYDICDGLASGNCSFNLEAGTVCHPVHTGNPFGDVTLIQDLTPHDGSTDVSVYTTCAVAFSMEMNRIYEIPEYVSQIDPPSIRRIQPYMYSFSLIKNGTTANITGSSFWSEENNIYTFDPIDALYGDTQYNIRVEARLRENGNDLRLRGSVFSEVRTSNFMTGPEPDHVVEENLNFTYPYRNQHNFLKGETQENFGYIRLLNGRNTFLTSEGDVSEYNTTFTAKFTSEDNEIITKDAYILDGTRVIAFNVTDLNPDKIYCLQIIRKDVPVRRNNSSQGIVFSASSMGSISDLTLQSGIQNLHSILGLSTVNSNQFKKITLPGGQVGQYEREIFSYYFKTSKYNTWYDKLKMNSNWQVAENSFGELKWLDFENDFNENLEWVDRRAFKVGENTTSREFTPRVKFYLKDEYPDEFDPYADSGEIGSNLYLRDVVRRNMVAPWITVNMIRLQAITDLRLVNPFITVPALANTWQTRLYASNITWHTTAPTLSPLNRGTINGAFGVTESLSSGATGTASSIYKPALSGIKGHLTLTTTTPPKTGITYAPHMRGWQHYRQLKSVITTFVHSNMNPVPFTAPFTLYNNYFNTTQRNIVIDILSRDNIVASRMTNGKQEFGAYYVFPSQNGVDIQGTIKSISFTKTTTIPKKK